MRLTLMLLCLQMWDNVGRSLSQNVCTKLPDVPHAHVSDETKKAEYQQGYVMHFTCETGYISGRTIRYICSSEGWLGVHDGVCYLKPCQLPDDTPNGYYQITNGDDFVFGATIKYFCNEGYHMASKEDTRTCLLENWTNHVPVCDPLSCDPPPADEEITVKGLPENDDPILPDRFLTFSCDGPGKHLNGSSSLLCGKDGQWNNPFPTCEDITCKAGVMHPKLHIVGAPTNGKMKVGHQLSFHCDDEHMLEGAAEIQCLHTGQWNAPFPTCEDKCKIPSISDSVHIISRIPGQQLSKGQKLKFSCRLRSHTVRGNAQVECLANGQWSAPFPTCGAPLGCGRAPALADGDIKDTLKFSYQHNERIEYTCQNYYTMQGGPFSTCINGQWTGQSRCLRPCTVNKDLMTTNNIRFKYSGKNKIYSTHGDEIEFSCTIGRPVGRISMRQRCDDGEMHLPSCQ